MYLTFTIPLNNPPPPQITKKSGKATSPRERREERGERERERERESESERERESETEQDICTFEYKKLH